jgi:hypothetical protein
MLLGRHVDPPARPSRRLSAGRWRRRWLGDAALRLERLLGLLDLGPRRFEGGSGLGRQRGSGALSGLGGGRLRWSRLRPRCLGKRRFGCRFLRRRRLGNGPFRSDAVLRKRLLLLDQLLERLGGSRRRGLLRGRFRQPLLPGDLLLESLLPCGSSADGSREGGSIPPGSTSLVGSSPPGAASPKPLGGVAVPAGRGAGRGAAPSPAGVSPEEISPMSSLPATKGSGRSPAPRASSSISRSSESRAPCLRFRSRCSRIASSSIPILLGVWPRGRKA